jgi:cyclophilin family peptidyl-prolyl cis-trans isomerase
MNKYISIAIVVVVIGLGIWLFATGNKTDDAIPGPDTDSEVAQLQEAENVDNKENINNLDNKKVMNATLKTNMGVIKIEFFATDAPKTVENFTKLAGSKFYDGIKFHRVIKGFMVQAGDPLTKDDSKASLWGTGGPGYKFADEIDSKSDLYAKVGYKKGVVAMANSGPNTNGSQFFIMTADYPLPSLYTIFGKVISGQDVVDKIALVKTGANDKPTEPIVIQSITLD